MNPFYFGDPETPLYGIYHPPRAMDTGLAVVLCYPIGGEYMRSHRAFRQLTNALTRQGAHVLRFDWYGTGDSGGDGPDASLSQWFEDLETSIDEMKDTAGVESVSLAGLRLGGTLAFHAGVNREDVTSVVLWDPVADGAEFLRTSMDSQPDDPEAWGYPPGTGGMGGFPVTPELRSDLARLTLDALPEPGGTDVRVIVSGESPEWETRVAGWVAAGTPAEYRCIPSEGDWSKGDRFGSALIPQAIIAGVVEALVAEVRT